MEIILTAMLSGVGGILLGWLVSQAKVYKSLQSAMKNLLKSQLTNQYYCYEKIDSVPRYIKEAWYAMFESYVGLKGNSFIINDIEPKFRLLKIEDE